MEALERRSRLSSSLDRFHFFDRFYCSGQILLLWADFTFLTDFTAFDRFFSPSFLMVKIQRQTTNWIAASRKSVSSAEIQIRRIRIFEGVAKISHSDSEETLHMRNGDNAYLNLKEHFFFFYTVGVDDAGVCSHCGTLKNFNLNPNNSRNRQRNHLKFFNRQMRHSS